MRRTIPILILLALLPIGATAVLVIPMDVTRQNQKEQDLEFTIRATQRDSSTIAIYVYMPLKGKLQTVDRMTLIAEDGKQLLFDIPLSFAVVDKRDGSKQAEAWPILISAHLIDKCLLCVYTGSGTGDLYYRIHLGSYAKKE